VLRNHPLAARLLPRLLYQLVPAALVTTVGVLLLSNLAKAPDAPAAAPATTAITAEAVFKIVPREPSADAKPTKAAPPRVAANPKPPSASATPPQLRKVASLPAPLPIVPITEPPQPAAAAPGETGIMSTLRSATTAARQIPQWAGRSVAGWFAADAPPRPPASVPGQDVQAAM
jgi:hypothetical protein